ncbi:hypothetical protein [Frankia sp. R82]|uniref:hypothetical protein n=1 Tax=Frankia sp. R82 TaxID=2950553 RepID=UPI0020430F4E|nr:hypothetical protein [Frankia sp. R82]MCM3885979.1 hypothetical protein [Frankia sp. R82]
MTKGMGRRAAALAISGIATVAFTAGVGTSAAHAFDDKKTNCGNQDKDKDKDDWGIFDDKNKDGGKDNPEKKAEADELNKGDGGNGLGADKAKDDGKDGDKDKDGDWFNWDDKDKKDDCPVGTGVVAGVGVGVGVGGVAGGVPAGGGGMAERGASSPLLPVAGATMGALLIGAGVARRRTQGAS